MTNPETSSDLVPVAWRHRGPKGGWITTEAGQPWSEQPLYDAATIERLTAELSDWRNGDLRGVQAHLEAFRERALAAESLNARQGEALRLAVGMCERYAEFIRRVPAADIEQHPYLPELEQIVVIGHAALATESSNG